ncbi:toll-like receptor 4 [Ylistrum balloti]|uniref:toll-like receptor 4 n=1 Tax=Ylistrum balloti TaxID=509963 RepID=UPI002905B139|nr:toll-like receptor 4 [Ylistrum balloti]
MCLLFNIGAVSNCCSVTRKESDVTCFGCQLKAVPRDLPISTTALNLENNTIEILDNNSFKDLLNLQHLILARNGMHSITPGTFDILGNLTYLDLSYNDLEHSAFDSSVFKRLHQLRFLYLHGNRFHLKKIYPENAISFLTSLQNLRIDIFNGFQFGNGFLNLTELRIFDVDHIGTERVSIQNTSFKGLANSKISRLYLQFGMKNIEASSLSPFSSLVSLVLDSKKSLTIQEVLLGLYGLRGRNMESVTLTSNHVHYSPNGYLAKSDMVSLGMICVRKLDMTSNFISGIRMEAVLAWTSRGCLQVLDISKNAITSPQLLSLLVLFPSIIYVYSSYQIVTFTRKRRVSMHEEKTVYLPKHLQHLSLDHDPFNFVLEDVTMVAEDNNLRVLDISYPAHRTECSEGYIQGLIHLEKLYISGWKCSTPSTHLFAKFPSLSHLEAKECDLGDRLSLDAESLFTGMFNLSYVDLAFNNIETLNSIIFNDQSHSLKTLNLTGNRMERLALETLEHLHVLETLDVRNNRISALSDTERSLIDVCASKSENFKIVLTGNPLVCSCDNLEFLVWFQTTKVAHDRDSIVCSTQEGKKVRITKFLETFDEFQDSCVAQFWLLISVTLALIGIFLGILFRLAWRKSVWLRVSCRQPLEHEIYPYDVFISYCDKDTKWVAKTLVPWLNEKNIEYCIDEKSFSPGLDQADNILNAIDNSHKTVFVVSCAFLEHQWPMFAMKLASTYSFRDGRENMNIIILLNDIKCSEFPKLIRKNWDIIRPLHWPNEKNTDRRQLIAATQTFWKRLVKRIQRGNDRFITESASESSL